MTPFFDKNELFNQIGIIIPTYCEASNIERLVDEIEDLHPQAQILLVDDSSLDGTANIVAGLQDRFSNIHLLVRSRKLGLGTAIIDGFKFFLASEHVPRVIVTMDADYSHDPKDISKLLSCFNDGDGLVIGSRYCKGGSTKDWSLARRVISKTANSCAISLLGLTIKDYTSGFRGYSIDFLRSTISHLHSIFYEIQIETTQQASLQGIKIREVPIQFVNRKHDRSKLSLSEVNGFLSYIWKTRKGY